MELITDQLLPEVTQTIRDQVTQDLTDILRADLRVAEIAMEPQADQAEVPEYLLAADLHQDLVEQEVLGLEVQDQAEGAIINFSD